MEGGRGVSIDFSQESQLGRELLMNSYVGHGLLDLLALAPLPNRNSVCRVSSIAGSLYSSHLVVASNLPILSIVFHTLLRS